jgi:hypothetical protein
VVAARARIDCHIASLRLAAAKTAVEIGRREKGWRNAEVSRTAIREAYRLGRAVGRAIIRREAMERLPAVAAALHGALPLRDRRRPLPPAMPRRAARRRASP